MYNITEFYQEVCAYSYPKIKEDDLSKDYFKDENDTWIPMLKKMNLDFNTLFGRIKKGITNFAEKLLDDINNAIGSQFC